MNRELPNVQSEFQRGRESDVKLLTFFGSWRKQGNNTYTSLTTLKPLTVGIPTNCGKCLKKLECQTILPASWETCMQVRRQQLELDMKQLTVSRLGKEYDKAGYCLPAYLTYMQSASWEMPGWMNHKLESGLLGELSISSDMQATPLYWHKVKRNRRPPWWRWKRVEKRA